MTDTNIKGSGNSRTLASVPDFLTRYPTYEDFAQALINRELPIDLGPLNPAGLKVRGTDLNKAALLKDSTAALYGLGTGAVPDDVLAIIRDLITQTANHAADEISKRAMIESGNYVGTGTVGAAGAVSITFSYVPDLVMVKPVNDFNTGVFIPRAISKTNFNGNGYSIVGSQASTAYCYAMMDEKTLRYYATIADSGLNKSGVMYEYIAIG